MSKLRQEFESRFEDFDRAAEDIQKFQNPFKCDIDKMPAKMQLKVIELTTNDSLTSSGRGRFGNPLSKHKSAKEMHNELIRPWLEHHLQYHLLAHTLWQSIVFLRCEGSVSQQEHPQVQQKLKEGKYMDFSHSKSSE
ncbi:hypothetical protein J6590_040640 [Homalodisca vitripennis]|nr:hypothetical protein J6590_040640 [Homalodisca vitripennis]